MKAIRPLAVAMTLAVVGLVTGCNLFRSAKETPITIEGPELDKVVGTLQVAMDQIIASPEWAPFRAETTHFAEACKGEADNVAQVCGPTQDAALAACASVGSSNSSIAAERCRRIFANDRTMCRTQSTNEVKSWCDLSGSEKPCATARRVQAVTCSAAKAVPPLTLVSARVVANVGRVDKGGVNASLLVLSLQSSRAVAHSSTVEVQLALRPTNQAYTGRDGTTWSPAGRMPPPSAAAKADVANIVDTVNSALRATAARFRWGGEGSDVIIPLRPSSFTFEFAFEATRTAGGGVEINLAPTPVKLGGSLSRDQKEGNKLVLVFGPEPSGSAGAP